MDLPYLGITKDPRGISRDVQGCPRMSGVSFELFKSDRGFWNRTRRCWLVGDLQCLGIFKRSLGMAMDVQGRPVVLFLIVNRSLSIEMLTVNQTKLSRNRKWDPFISGRSFGFFYIFDVMCLTWIQSEIDH